MDASFLVLMHMVANTSIDCFVRAFTGTVSFGMVSQRQFQFDTSEFMQSMPEFGDEKFIMVRDNVLR